MNITQAEGVIEYEVYGYDDNDHQSLEVHYRFTDGKKAMFDMKRRGLQDIKMTKTDGWDLYQSWEFVSGGISRTE